MTPDAPPTPNVSLMGRFRLDLGPWIAISILVPLLLCAGACWYDRIMVQRSIQTRILATTDALAAHAEAVMQTASLAIQMQLDRVGAMEWEDIGRSEQIHGFLQNLNAGLPQIASSFYVDPQGRNSVSSRTFPMPPYDVHDREYFMMAHEQGDQLVVSPPFNGLSEGDRGFVAARARLRNGVFDGLAAVTLSPRYFLSTYRGIAPQSDNATALLMRADGTILAHYPAVPGIPVRIPTDSPIMQAAARHVQSAWFEARAPFDHRTRIGVVRWLEDRDLIIAYSVDRDLSLAGWYADVGIFLAFAALAALALGLTAHMAMRRAAEERSGLQALIAETERRQRAEAGLQQMQKMEALGRLTGGVAHDFNNLLAAILGSLELAQRRVADPAVTKLLGAATQAAQRGARLTSQMLAFSRSQPLTLEAFDPNEVMRGMDELLQRSVGPLVRLTWRLQPSVWPVLADRVQLEVALLNLVVNANQAMPDGGEIALGSANVAAQEAAAIGLPPREHVTISVSDTGEGMSEAVKASAFEPFFTTKGPGKGTGLGLSMVHGFATQAGGTVRIASAPGEGTTVTLYLPRSETSVVGDGGDEDLNALGPSGTLHVLLVDDDESVRLPTRSLLEADGHAVTDVASGAEAVALLRSGQPFDVMLADFAMPGMNGGELASNARQHRPDLPIVFVTGYAEDSAMRRWIDRGSSKLEKPFTGDALNAALRKAVAGRD